MAFQFVFVNKKVSFSLFYSMKFILEEVFKRWNSIVDLSSSDDWSILNHERSLLVWTERYLSFLIIRHVFQLISFSLANWISHSLPSIPSLSFGHLY